MKLIFLGTNGWYDTHTGSTICTLLRAPDMDIILDAGFGIHKADTYGAGADGRPVYLFLSHYHLDHIAGLHILAKFAFTNGLIICIPAGTRSLLNFLIADPFTLSIDRLPYPVQVLELPDERASIPFEVHAEPLRHASLTLGYRLMLDGRIVAYCPDTGYCENAVRLARGADMLIAECAYKAGRDSEEWPHLNPETAARIASEGNAKRLIMTHFDARLYESLEEREVSAAVARLTFPRTIAAKDDLVVEL